MTNHFVETNAAGKCEAFYLSDTKPPPSLPGHLVHAIAPRTEVGWPVGPTQWHELMYNSAGFYWEVCCSLASLRAEKIASLSADCANHITAGFTSSALGAPHLYPAKPQDQANLVASVTDSLISVDVAWTTPFWCADAAGVWGFRPHTKAQIQQVGREAKAAILAAMSKNETLRAQVESSTEAEVLAITW